MKRIEWLACLAMVAYAFAAVLQFMFHMEAHRLKEPEHCPFAGVTIYRATGIEQDKEESRS